MTLSPSARDQALTLHWLNRCRARVNLVPLLDFPEPDDDEHPFAAALAPQAGRRWAALELSCFHNARLVVFDGNRHEYVKRTNARLRARP